MMRRRSGAARRLSAHNYVFPGVLKRMIWKIIEWSLILAGAADAAAIALWYACSWPTSQILGPALVRGPRSGRRVALTFDDGPAAPYTGQILDVLREHGVRATFFVCGKDAIQHPDILRRIQAEGHSLGNHAWSHSYLYFMRRSRLSAEIDRTQEAIRAATGQAPRLFRPPYGGRWFGLYPLLRERGMKLIQWSVNAYDWKLDAEGIAAAVCARLKPGDVILMHDGRQDPGGYLQNIPKKGGAEVLPKHEPGASTETVKSLPAIIEHARAAGFVFVPVDEFCSA